MKKLNKKIILIAALILIAVFFAIIYLKPLTLSDIANENSTLLFTKVSMVIKDGEHYHESENYKNITDEQKQEILLLLNNYPYHRNFKTLFSDGSLADNSGDGYFYISIYYGANYQGTAIIAYDNEISYNNKNYTMNNSSDFISEILDIISE